MGSGPTLGVSVDGGAGVVVEGGGVGLAVAPDVAAEVPCVHGAFDVHSELLSLVAVGGDFSAGVVAEVGAVAGVVPNGLAALIVEVAGAGVPAVGVYLADLARLHEEGWECEDVVGQVAQGPVFELDELVVEVLDLDLFVGLEAAGAVVEDLGDAHIVGGGRPG